MYNIRENNKIYYLKNKLKYLFNIYIKYIMIKNSKKNKNKTQMNTKKNILPDIDVFYVPNNISHKSINLPHVNVFYEPHLLPQQPKKLNPYAKSFYVKDTSCKTLSYNAPSFISRTPLIPINKPRSSITVYKLQKTTTPKKK